MPVDSESPTELVVLADLDENFKIDAKDALATLKVLVGKNIPTEAQKAAADVNNDGEVNAKDALEILKKSVGKPACF